MLGKVSGVEVMGKNIAYFEGAQGFLVKPKETGTYPGIVMVHEWWGLNDNIRATAETLAKEGYVVLAVDLYHGEVATTRERAQELRNTLTKEAGIANLKAAVKHLRNENAQKIASLGWCFGGGKSLELALSGEKLDATVIYYGSLNIDRKELKKISWPVLGIFGEEDSSIPTSTVHKFRDALTSLGITNNIHIYPGVGHAFANPSGASYAANETKDAWQKTVAFLEQTLK